MQASARCLMGLPPVTRGNTGWRYLPRGRCPRRGTSPGGGTSGVTCPGLHAGALGIRGAHMCACRACLPSGPAAPPPPLELCAFVVPHKCGAHCDTWGGPSSLSPAGPWASSAASSFLDSILSHTTAQVNVPEGQSGSRAAGPTRAVPRLPHISSPGPVPPGQLRNPCLSLSSKAPP